MKQPILNKKTKAAPSLLLGLALLAAPTFASTYYISPTGQDTSPGDGTSGHPWQTLAKALGAAGAGDTIIAQNGTYHENFKINKSGTSTSPITVKAQNRLGAIIDAQMTRAHGALITGHHITFDGFKVRNAYDAGIDIDGTHDVTVQYCESSGNQKAGIYAGGSDFIWIQHNEVYNNAWGDEDGQGNKIVTSGISVHLPQNVTGNTDDVTTSRINVLWNVVHDNYQASTANPTDGAGIILDDLRCAASNLPDYEFPSTVEDNLCYNNGGAGIKLFSTRFITCRNNTCVRNNADHRDRTWRAEISIINCDDVDVVNNIACCDTDSFSVEYSQFGAATAESDRSPLGNFVQDDRVVKNYVNYTYTGNNTNIVFKNNLLYDYNNTALSEADATNTTSGQAVAHTTNNNQINATPGFIDATYPGYNYRLNGGSGCHAKNTGTTSEGYKNKDLDGNTRPQQTIIDIGCYEYMP